MSHPRPLRSALLAISVVAATLVGTAYPTQAVVPVGAPITVRATASGTSTSGEGVTVAKPSGTMVGDVLVARVANRDDVTAEINSPGWTIVGTTNSASQLKSVVLTRVVSASEPSSYRFKVSARSNLVASVTAFDNVDLADPVDTYTGKVNAHDNLLSTPAVTTTVGNAMAVWFATQVNVSDECTSSLFIPPAGLTEVLDDCLPDSDGLAHAAAYRQLGAAAVRSGWTGSTDVDRTNVTQVVTLRPASTVQASDRFVSASVNVGKPWDGYDELGARDTSLTASELHEPSGLAASRVNADVQYVHSESDVKGMVAVSTKDARVLGKYNVAIPQQWDWEDIATGPCPSGSCIFAGDIGRSNGKPNPPSTFSVYRVPEPDLSNGETSGTLTGDWFRFRYPDAPHNAEALVVHPGTGRIYVITKEKDGRSGVYAFPTTMPEPSETTITTLTEVATLQLPTWTGDPLNLHAATWFAQVTAAAIHPLGDRFLVRTPYVVYEYRGTSFDVALTAAPARLTAPTSEGQGEAIEYAPDGSAYFTLGERAAPPYMLKRIDRG